MKERKQNFENQQLEVDIIRITTHVNCIYECLYVFV